MRKTKRLLACILTFALILGVFPANATFVKAKTPITVTTFSDLGRDITVKTITPKTYAKRYAKKTVRPSGNNGKVLDGEEAVTYARACLKDHQPEFSFTTSENLSAADIYFGAVAHTGVADEGDYLRTQIATINITKNEDTFTVTTIYHSTKEEEQKFKEEVKKFFKDLKLSKRDEGETLRLVYSFCTCYVTYDHNAADANKQSDTVIPSTSYTAYGALVNRKAVCQGISAFLYYVYNSWHIPCRILLSDTHAWNAVFIEPLEYNFGREYYQLDATWDIENNPGNPKYYLVGRKQMNALPEHQISWDSYDLVDDENDLLLNKLSQDELYLSMMTLLKKNITNIFYGAKLTLQVLHPVTLKALKEGVDYKVTRDKNNNVSVIGLGEYAHKKQYDYHLDNTQLKAPYITKFVIEKKYSKKYKQNVWRWKMKVHLPNQKLPSKTVLNICNNSRLRNLSQTPTSPYVRTISAISKSPTWSQWGGTNHDYGSDEIHIWETGRLGYDGGCLEIPIKYVKASKGLIVSPWYRVKHPGKIKINKTLSQDNLSGTKEGMEIRLSADVSKNREIVHYSSNYVWWRNKNRLSAGLKAVHYSAKKSQNTIFLWEEYYNHEGFKLDK